MIAHHHIDDVIPTLVDEDIFANNEAIYYDQRPTKYDREQVIIRALKACAERRHYSWLWQNCQHFVNDIANNTHICEGLERGATKAIIGGIGLAFLGLLFKNNFAIAAGTAIVGAGAGTKVLNQSFSNTPTALPYGNIRYKLLA